MNIQNLINTSIKIITRYYQNDLTPFFEVLDDDFLWIGPAEKQWIRGKKNLIDTFKKEQNNLTFTMSNISATSIPTGNRSCEIILTYLVYTHYPNGKSHVHDQRLHYTWKEYLHKDETGKRIYDSKLMMLHISNAFPYNELDTIYPIHYKELSIHEIPQTMSGKHFTAKGADNATYYLLFNSIQWIESQKNSKNSILHTTDGNITITESISSLEKKYPEFFLRIHTSYLINPLYAYKLCRFKLTLTDGTVLPIPEKKYTYVKSTLNDYLEKANAENKV